MLRRVPFDEVAASPELAEGIRKIFGEALTPDQVVAQRRSRSPREKKNR